MSIRLHKCVQVACVSTIMKVLLNITVFSVVGVRTEAASGVPHLLRCVIRHMRATQSQDTTLLLNLWNFLFSQLLQALIHETDREIVTVQYEALCDVKIFMYIFL